MARKNNCDHQFLWSTKHKPRFRLQPVLLAVMGHIQNPVQSLGKMIVASVRALDRGQHEQKPSSAAQLQGGPWLVPCCDCLPVKGESSVPSCSQDSVSCSISSLALSLSSLGLEGNSGKVAREELLSTSLLCLQLLSLGLLSAAVPVTAEHLHRVTSLFPVVDDIIPTAGGWCAHLMCW